MGRKEGQGTEHRGQAPPSRHPPHLAIPAPVRDSRHAPLEETLHAKIHAYHTDTLGRFLHYKRILRFTRGLSTWET